MVHVFETPDIFVGYDLSETNLSTVQLITS
jgi:hypothetical protein